MKTVGVRGAVVVPVLAFALFVGVSAASAGTVNWFSGCYQRGTATTTPGPLTLTSSWVTVTQSMLSNFLSYEYVTYTVNGVSTTTTAGWGSPVPTPVQRPNGSTTTGYKSVWTSPVLANLASGESVTVSLEFRATKPVQDDTLGKPYPANTPLFPVHTCTITAQ